MVSPQGQPWKVANANADGVGDRQALPLPVAHRQLPRKAAWQVVREALAEGLAEVNLEAMRATAERMVALKVVRTEGEAMMAERPAGNGRGEFRPRTAHGHRGRSRAESWVRPQDRDACP